VPSAEKAPPSSYELRGLDKEIQGCGQDEEGKKDFPDEGGTWMSHQCK
jgi:hypothetical protein